MNAVWNSYGQLCGCPEIFKKSCKFFCRGLDIRVTKIMESDMWQVICLENSGEVCSHETRLDDFTNLIDIDVIKVIW